MGYLILFTSLCFIFLGVAFIRPVFFYQYPYFMAATFGAFLLPQAFALCRADWGGAYLDKMLIMASLSLVACWIGNLPPVSERLLLLLSRPVDANRLLHGGFALVAFGYLFTWRIASLPEEVRNESAWTGVITVYAFFAQLVYPGFAICLFSALKDRAALGWIVALIAAAIPLQAAIFYARREPTALFILTFALGFYFLRGRIVSRWIAIASVLAAAFLIPATGQYRSLAAVDPVEALKQIDLSGLVQNLADDDAVSEVKNATLVIAATSLRNSYQWGAGYWNMLVFRFIPAQLLGKAFKESLTIFPENNSPDKLLEDTFAFTIPPGSTITGIGDAYYQFGFPGCLVFALIGYLFRVLWVASHQEHATIAQILYIQTMTVAMRALTHQTVDFLPGFLFSLIFIGSIALYATNASTDPDANYSLLGHQA